MDVAVNPKGTDVPYDGGARAFAVAEDVRKMWRIAPAGDDSEGKLLCRSVAVRSMVVALIFGKNSGARGNRTLTILDPNTWTEVTVPRTP